MRLANAGSRAGSLTSWLKLWSTWETHRRVPSGEIVRSSRNRGEPCDLRSETLIGFPKTSEATYLSRSIPLTKETPRRLPDGSREAERTETKGDLKWET